MKRAVSEKLICTPWNDMPRTRTALITRCVADRWSENAITDFVPADRFIRGWLHERARIDPEKHLED